MAYKPCEKGNIRKVAVTVRLLDRRVPDRIDKTWWRWRKQNDLIQKLFHTISPRTRTCGPVYSSSAIAITKGTLDRRNLAGYCPDLRSCLSWINQYVFLQRFDRREAPPPPSQAKVESEIGTGMHQKQIDVKDERRRKEGNKPARTQRASCAKATPRFATRKCVKGASEKL